MTALDLPLYIPEIDIDPIMAEVRQYDAVDDPLDSEISALIDKVHMNQMMWHGIGSVVVGLTAAIAEKGGLPYASFGGLGLGIAVLQRTTEAKEMGHALLDQVKDSKRVKWELPFEKGLIQAVHN